MKMALIIIGIIAFIFIVFQIYITMSTGKSETQAYKVIKVEKDFEIRFYPATTMAMISSSAKTFKALGSSGFPKLASYIFGGNKDKKQIAMTSPVHMAIGDSNASMGFVMPATYDMNNLPLPNSSDIVLKTIPDAYVAAITFSGFSSDEAIKKQTVLLENALKAKGIIYSGQFSYLGYNPPYQLFGRRNEIIVTIDKNQLTDLLK